MIKSLEKPMLSLVLGVVLTALSYLLVYLTGLDYEFSTLEALAVVTSFSCVILCVWQDRWNYPIGIVGLVLYSIILYQADLFGIMLFNLYMVGALLFGYWRWGGKDNRLRVTNLQGIDDYYLYVGIGAFLLVFLYALSWFFGFEVTPLDATAAALSGVAQFLMDNKRRQTWIVWGVVNVVSIVLYFKVGLFLAMIQYVLFLLNSIYGWYTWSVGSKGN